jgi:hypothetical protein
MKRIIFLVFAAAAVAGLFFGSCKLFTDDSDSNSGGGGETPSPGTLILNGFPQGTFAEVAIYNHSQDIATQAALNTAMEATPIATAGGSDSPLYLKTGQNQTFSTNGNFLVVVMVTNNEVLFRAGVPFSNGCAQFNYSDLRNRSDLPGDLVAGTLIITGLPSGTSVTVSVYNHSGSVASQAALESAKAGGSIATANGSTSNLTLTSSGQAFTQSGTFLVVVTANGAELFKTGVVFATGGAAFNYADLVNKNTLPAGDGGETISKYAETFWGEWIRLDNGDTWYISGNSIKINGNATSTTPSLTKQSAQVIKTGEGYFLFASRTANASLRGRVVFMDDGTAGSSSLARAGIGNLPIDIILPDQPEKDPIRVVPDPITGYIETPPTLLPVEPVIGTFPENPEIPSITLQPLLVPPPDDPGYVPPITIIPIVTQGVNLKARLMPANSTTDTTRLYADGTLTDFILEIENVGTEDCTAATYELVYNNSDLVINDPAPNRRLGTLTPSKDWKEGEPITYKKSIPLSITPRPLSGNAALKDIEIGVKINDTIARKTWDDSVPIRYNRDKIPFRIGADSPVQGVIKVPGGLTHWFKTTASSSDGIYTYTVELPWSNQDYFVIFSGADASTEAAYALAINTALPPVRDFTAFDDLGIYEDPDTGGPNDDEAHSVLIESKASIMAYIHKNDVDYYRINLGNEVPVIKLVPLETYEFSDTGGNYDGAVNPGESAYLDLVVKNETNQSRSLTTVTLSATGSGAQYITINKGTASTSSIPSQYYASLTGSPASSMGNVGFLVDYNLGSALKLSVSPTCPVGTSIPLVLSFRDSQNMTWTENITLTVAKPDDSIAIAEPAADNCVLSQSSGNSDGFVNPGERFFYDITIKNSGTKTVSGLQGDLTTTASGVTISPSTASWGTLEPGLTKTASFSFEVSSSCPPGTVIPFALALESSTGTTWQAAPPDVTVRAAAPLNVKAAGAATDSVKLEWDTVTGAASYQVYYATSETGSYSLAGTSTVASYTHTGRSPGTIYYYKVSTSGSAGGESPLSAAVSAKTWMDLVFNKSAGETAATNLPERYRFYVSSGVSYVFESDTSCEAAKADGSSWFSLNSGPPQTQAANFTGWAVITIGSAGAYNLKITSGEAAVSGFSIGSDTGTVNNTDKTISVLVPYAANLASLTATPTLASGWTSVTTGAQDFSGPAEYLFSKSGAVQAYTVTVTRRGQGDITITPPGGDISVTGFPTAPITVSRSGSVTTYTITISDTSFSKYEWYVDDVAKTADTGSNNRAFTIKAADYVIGKHTVTIIVTKGGVPYSNEQTFTVAN